LEDYHAKLTRPQDKQLRLAIERVIRIFKSRLFQALLGKSLSASSSHASSAATLAPVCVRNEHWRILVASAARRGKNTENMLFTDASRLKSYLIGAETPPNGIKTLARHYLSESRYSSKLSSAPLLRGIKLRRSDGDLSPAIPLAANISLSLSAKCRFSLSLSLPLLPPLLSLSLPKNPRDVTSLRAN